MRSITKKLLKETDLDPRSLWYVSHSYLRSKDAVNDATRLATWINSGGDWDSQPPEEALFRGLHTCAFQASRKGGEKGVSQSMRNRWAQRWLDIREYIVELNIGLVYTMLKKVGTNDADEDDLLSEGLLALTRAVERFNPWKGYRFSTYACNAIGRALIRRRQREHRYRDRFPVQHDVDYEKPSALPDTNLELLSERLHHTLDQNLADLTSCESDIIAQRFPMDIKQRRTLKEIGENCGMSKERVRQIQTIALCKIRNVMECDPVLR